MNFNSFVRYFIFILFFVFLVSCSHEEPADTIKINLEPELEFSKLYSYIIFQKNTSPEKALQKKISTQEINSKGFFFSQQHLSFVWFLY